MDNSSHSRLFRYSLPIGIVGGIISILLFVTNGLYELLIPLVENSSLSGAAFKFWDNFVFYLPIGLLVVFILYAVVGIFVNKRITLSSITSFLRGKTDPVIKQSQEITKHQEWLSHSYQNVCPNCGSPRKTDESVCRYCGHNLRK